MADEPDSDPLEGMKTFQVMEIAQDPDHPLHDAAVRRMAPIARSVAEHANKTLADAIAPVVAQQASASRVMDAAMGAMRAGWDREFEKAQAVLGGPTFSPIDLTDITPAPNPMFDVLDENRKSNELQATLLRTMGEMLDVAKQDAANARADAKAARFREYLAIGVAVLVGVAAILAQVLGGG